MDESKIDMMAMMKGCMKGRRWCAFMPIAFGIVLFLLGYFLNSEVVRILWLTISGSIILMGIFCLIIMRSMTKKEDR